MKKFVFASLALAAATLVHAESSTYAVDPSHTFVTWEASTWAHVEQQGDLEQLVWSCNEVVAQLSTQYRLLPGDLVDIGTLAGVGPLRPGDRVEAIVEGFGRLPMTVGAAA